MGADPASMALLAGMLGSSVIGGITAPEGQELTSFENIPGADPAQMLGEGKEIVGNMLEFLLGRAEEPIQLKSTVNPLPMFAGGGLPFAIAAPGMDQNRLNNDLRTKHVKDGIARVGVNSEGKSDGYTHLSKVDYNAGRRRTPNRGVPNVDAPPNPDVPIDRPPDDSGTRTAMSTSLAPRRLPAAAEAREQFFSSSPVDGLGDSAGDDQALAAASLLAGMTPGMGGAGSGLQRRRLMAA